jgi:copper(I)-binding protein
LAIAAVALALVTPVALAQVTVSDAWVRATVPQQKATGAFMELRGAGTQSRLVEASSPVAGIVEIHEMAMDGNVMRMRAVTGVDVPAGKGVSLRPGGYHVMLMELKNPIQVGDKVPLTLVFEGANKQRQTVEVTATARPLSTPAAPAQKGGDAHGGAHKH